MVLAQPWAIVQVGREERALLVLDPLYVLKFFSRFLHRVTNQLLVLDLGQLHALELSVRVLQRELAHDLGSFDRWLALKERVLLISFPDRYAVVLFFIGVTLDTLEVEQLYRLVGQARSQVGKEPLAHVDVVLVS